jgi:rubrerythrin
MADPMRPIRSREELLSVAEAMEREAATRYRQLASRLRAQGDGVVASEFEALAEIEDRHVRDVEERASAVLGGAGHAKAPGPKAPNMFGDEEARAALVNPYQALAFAVRNEERAFAFYTYAAAGAPDEATRALAEDLARDELDHASRLRRLRRRAFHRDRPANLEIPENTEALGALARTWEMEAAIAHGQLADLLESKGEAAQAAMFRRLAEDEEAAAAGAPAMAPPTVATVAEGLRVVEATFDRLAWIGDHAKSEDVVAEAQRWAERMVSRLALAGSALGA